MTDNNTSVISVIFGQSFSLTQMILLIAGILTILTIIYKSIQSCIPKEVKHNTNFKYVDFQTSYIVEEKQYEFYWGGCGFKKYKFPHFPCQPDIEIFYKPILGVEDKVPVDRCIITKKDTYCSVEFTDTMFFKNVEAEYIKICAKTKIDNMKPYVDNISVIEKGNTIVIKNRNDIEIKNYPVKIPLNFDILEKRLDLLKYGSLTAPENYTGVENMILLVHLPKKEIESPGEKTIDFN